MMCVQQFVQQHIELPCFFRREFYAFRDVQRDILCSLLQSLYLLFMDTLKVTYTDNTMNNSYMALSV